MGPMNIMPTKLQGIVLILILFGCGWVAVETILWLFSFITISLN